MNTPPPANAPPPPAQPPAPIHIGTSSWLFDAWRGVFYPDKLPSRLYLSHYVRAFDTVEVNTSFYAIPSPNTVVGWVDAAPPGFTFALKFPRAISHERRLSGAEAESLAFLEVLRSMGPAAGPSFLQLPPDFTRRTYGRALAAYLDWLAPRAAGLRIAVEVRAADLMTEAFAAFLAERGFTLVLVDREGTPDLWDAWRAADPAPPFAFVRWIGDDRHGPQGDRELQRFRDEELARWAERLAQLAQNGVESFGYVHNPYEGHSPATVRRLRALLAGQVALPAWPPGDAVAPGEQLPLL